MDKKEAKEIVKVLALSGLPLVLSPIGTALLTLANECFNSSAKTRQDEWMKTLAKRIDEQNESFAEKIRNTQNFASLFANAQNGALTDIESDKVGLYANAFINAIKNENMEDTKKHIFLNMLRDFTKLHIEILRFFSTRHSQKGGPQRQVYQNLRTNKDILSEIDPIFEADREFIQVILVDLKNRSFIQSDNIDRFIVSFGTVGKQTTSFGDEFLAFISEQGKIND